MKKLSLIAVFCILITGLMVQSSRAQQPVFFAVFEEMVSPADLVAFNKVQQETVDLWNKYNLNVTISCYATDESSYYWVMPMQNFASMDAMFEKSADFMKKAKEQEGFDGSGFRDLSTSNFMYIRWVPDLSYHPDGNRGQTADRSYVEWSFCYLKQGHEKQASEAIKKYIDFYNKTGEKYEWDVFEGMLGNDLPVWVLMVSDSDPVAMRQTEKKLNDKYSKDFEGMWTEFTKHVRRLENKTGWFKPEWSVSAMQ